MRSRGVGTRVALLLAAAGVVLGAPSLAKAQAQAGVVVDAQGVLHTKMFADPGGMLTQQRIAAAKAALDPELATHSPIRYISLNRLEAAIAQRQGAPTDAMRNLGGLLRVKYVFYFPESKDIVIAGPAEGWMVDPAGRTVGIQSGRPVVQLQDLVVALRAFPPGRSGEKLIGCSIDPTPEGLAAMQRFLQTIGSRATPNDTQYIVEGLQTSLGLQKVSINGVSPKTHFAQVLVEADYRMKLIGIGLEQPPIRLVSYVERANPSQVSRNAMQRWFFTPDYQCVRVSEDRLAMELVGDGVKLVGENEMVTAGGQRQTTTRTNKASQAFVTGFTQKYPQLAERSPVYAELRNLIDLSVAAAFIQQEGYCQKAGWNMELFGDERQFAVETYHAPQMVATAVNAIWKGRQLMTPVGGGVSIHAEQALQDQNLLADDAGQVAKAHQGTKLDLAEGQWWWD
ncbi:MAG: DUF1598 domain-containing protein [Pirellulales bacterium]|nr:DUF1598 domain-containing protein [Pirellulales bacterium]